MTMPHQVYCDYLEDKGIDCRLLRSEEADGMTLNSLGTFLGDPQILDYGNGDGGYSNYNHSQCYFTHDGDGHNVLGNKIFYIYSYRDKYLGSGQYGS